MRLLQIKRGEGGTLELSIVMQLLYAEQSAVFGRKCGLKKMMEDVQACTYPL